MIIQTCFRAARTREDLPDIINMAIEELIRQRYELPAFSALLRIARTTRYSQNRAYQERVFSALNADARGRLQSLLRREDGEARSSWDRIKREPSRATVLQFKEALDHLRWMQQLNVASEAFADIPEVKIRQFAAEARSLDLASLSDMPERKRFTLVSALILKRVAGALDDVADMFLRQVRRMHNKAEEALTLYRSAHPRLDKPEPGSYGRHCLSPGPPRSAGRADQYLARVYVPRGSGQPDRAAGSLLRPRQMVAFGHRQQGSCGDGDAGSETLF